MKSIVLGTASIAALLAAGPALAQSNTSTVDQQGTATVATVTQGTP